MKEKDQFFKVKPERHQYLGDRYFRFNHNAEKAVQICVTAGDVKKGKSHTFGIYLIHKITLFSNYLTCGYLEPCSKKEYEAQFKKVVKLLK